ncbi:MAG: methenyltetrahydromethanopterin cyclohydrolase [Nitrospinota bacterium]|nr:methenyltetrahydromethanopterin cyclohydrolase [Nitrospinota bacterium]
MVSLNQSALDVIGPVLANPGLYGVHVEKGPKGATFLDFGIDAPGGYPAAIIFSRACLAGMGDVTITSVDYGAIALPTVNVSVALPTLSCMASQYAGWAISQDTYFAMGSGPARALKADEKIFEEIDHKETGKIAVLCMETNKKPPEEVVNYILKKTGAPPEELYLLMAPTSSITGSVQVSARVVETAVHKMHEIGFKLGQITAGSGAAPIAPIHPDGLEAIGRTNDCVLYGSTAHMTVDCDDAFIVEKIGEIPSSSSKDYGRTFKELFAEYGDFYNIDPLLFSPARITVANARTGSFFSAGSINPTMLAKSFGYKI